MSTETQTTTDAVRTALDRVYDPELDRSLIELDFVRDIQISDRVVTVSLRLPTGLCSPSFAWMMASDARDTVEELPGVDDATIKLCDHIHEEEITNGIDEGLSFEDVFEDAEDDLTELRRMFDHKARLSRQHEAMTTLLDEGVTPGELVEILHSNVRLGEQATITVGRRRVTVQAEMIESYLEKVDALGIDQTDNAPLFVTPDEESIPPDEFESVLKRTRLSNVNMDGQAHQCSLLLKSRYDD